jgi:molybdopterin synthase catalytic subunit/molybdopterin converting factor small subunit
MRVVVRLFAGLRERAGAEELVLEDLPEPLDLAGLKRELESRRPELGSLRGVSAAIGTEWAGGERPLRNDDEVALLPPVSGGSGRSEPSGAEDEALAQGLFELSAEALDPARDIGRVRHPDFGGLALFVGTTRGVNRGKRVRFLEYEAHAPLAGAEMARIFQRCRALHGDLAPGATADDRRLRMLCRHRTGRVEVGEPAVVIAVASPHRAPAFEACRFLIDALKESLPVWKKETDEDGHHWVGDRP